MKILFIHGTRGDKFKVLLAPERHDLRCADFASPNNLVRLKILRRCVRKGWRPDLIIADDHGLFAFYAFVTATIFRCSYMIRLRGDNWDEEYTKLRSMTGFGKLRFAVSRWIYFRLGDFALRRANRILPVSNFLADVIVHRLKISSTRLKVIPVPIDPSSSAFTPSSVDEKIKLRNELGIPCSNLIVMVTNFRFEKKVAAIHHFWPQLKELFRDYPGLRIVTAGSGPLLEKMKEKIMQDGLKDKFILLGQHQNIPKLMSAADLFLHLSFQDAFPNVVLEAQNVGVPVIVNRACGMVEQVDAGTGGAIVDSDDPASLVLEINRILKDPHLASFYIENARRFIRDKYGLRPVSREMEQVLNTLKLK